VALMHLGPVRAHGAPQELRDSLGAGASLEDVFRYYTGAGLDEGPNRKGGLREIRGARRTARRVG
jgi:ABC-2 type transport system ATP-binding protein